MATVFPSTYLGTDISCLTDLNTIDILISGNDMLAQRLMRRTSVAEGAMNIIDPDPNSAQSIDMAQFINATITDQVAIGLQQALTSIYLADQEVLDASVQVIAPKQNRVLIVNATITSALGPFTLTTTVDQLNATILYEVK